MAVEALYAGPAEVAEHININAELLNIPSVGVEGNDFFPSAQINIAPVSSANSRQ